MDNNAEKEILDNNRRHEIMKEVEKNHSDLEIIGFNGECAFYRNDLPVQERITFIVYDDQDEKGYEMIDVPKEGIFEIGKAIYLKTILYRSKLNTAQVMLAKTCPKTVIEMAVKEGSRTLSERYKGTEKLKELNGILVKTLFKAIDTPVGENEKIWNRDEYKIYMDAVFGVE